jgi:hypothetical protein
MSTNTGGSAFPYVADADFNYGTGMTLRDYFAAKAMQADMTDGIHENDFPSTAARAYKMADAMLKERTL